MSRVRVSKELPDNLPMALFGASSLAIPSLAAGKKWCLSPVLGGVLVERVPGSETSSVAIGGQWHQSKFHPEPKPYWVWQP